jgi:IS1 family transposase
MHRIAFRLQVSVQAVRTWLRTCAKAHEETPEPTGKPIVLERDERWHDRKKTRQQRWIWNALDRATGQLLDWAGGRHDQATLKPRVDRLAPGDVKLSGTAHWVTSASVIPHDTLVQSHATTHAIARHHGRQRHGFGRFKRKAMMVSHSAAMVHLTMALFATFWVNGNQDELLSRLG